MDIDKFLATLAWRCAENKEDMNNTISQEYSRWLDTTMIDACNASMLKLKRQHKIFCVLVERRNRFEKEGVPSCTQKVDKVKEK